MRAELTAEISLPFANLLNMVKIKKKKIQTPFLS
jgi:hypothetical protein